MLTRIDPERFRKQPRQARSRRTVDTLLDATLKVVAEEGFEAASTNRIAKIAGVSVGSLYQYFIDKRGLIGAAIERALLQEQAAVRQALDAQRSATVAVQMASGFEALLANRVQQSPMLCTLFEHNEELASTHALLWIAARHEALADPIHRVIASRRDARHDTDLETLQTVVTGAANAISSAFVLTDPQHLTPEALARSFGIVVERYLTTPAPPAGGAAPTASPPSLEVPQERASVVEAWYREERRILEVALAQSNDWEACRHWIRGSAEILRGLVERHGRGVIAAQPFDRDAWVLIHQRRAQRLRARLSARPDAGAERKDTEVAVFLANHAADQLVLQLGLRGESRPFPEALADETAWFTALCLAAGASS